MVLIKVQSEYAYSVVTMTWMIESLVLQENLTR